MVAVTDFRERGRSVVDDPWHEAERLDVIDDRRASIKPLEAWVRRPLLGLGSVVLDGSDQDCFFTHAHATGQRDHLDVDVDAAPERVRADVALLLSEAHDSLKPLARERRALTERDIGTACADGVRGKGHSLDDGVRIRLHQRPIDAGSRISLKPVRHDIAFVGWLLRRGPPLGAGRICGTPAAAQPRVRDESNDRGRVGRADRLLPRLPRAGLLGRGESPVRLVRAEAGSQDRGHSGGTRQDLHHASRYARAGRAALARSFSAIFRALSAVMPGCGWPSSVTSGSSWLSPPPTTPPQR